MLASYRYPFSVEPYGEGGFMRLFAMSQKH